VINGEAESGKDTLCDFIISSYYAEKITSITPILKIALDNGWDGTKDNKSRKLLSNLKRAFSDFNNLPNNYLINESNRFIESNNDILFVHIRESDQIEAFLANIRDACLCCTLLISKKRNNASSWGNDSDDCVDNYHYEYKYNNDKRLEEAEDDFLNFFQKLLQEKKINPRKRE
jgi:hypothetical protein